MLIKGSFLKNPKQIILVIYVAMKLFVPKHKKAYPNDRFYIEL